MKIRRIDRADYDQLFQINCDVHLGEPYKTIVDPKIWAEFAKFYQDTLDNRQAFYKRMDKYTDDPNRVGLVAVQDGRAVGYQLIQRSDDELALCGIFVSPNYQGRGIGTELLKAATDMAVSGEKISLLVLEGNKKAQKLYQRLGFERVYDKIADFRGMEQIKMVRYA